MVRMRIVEVFICFAIIYLYLKLTNVNSTSIPLKIDDSKNSYTGSTKYPGCTEGVPVRQIHSHNDYWRERPFYDAIERGVQSIEADVWLINDTLYVGHNPYTLTEDRTLDKLYINPIIDSLYNINNPDHRLITNKTIENFTKQYNLSSATHGLFDSNGLETIYLWIDVKTDGLSTWLKVIEELQPLREKGYLTEFNKNVVTTKQVTVIGTGNTPLNYILEQSTRDYFFDAPLSSLNSTFSSKVSPIASTNLIDEVGKPNLNGLNETGLEIIKKQIEKAHSLGIKTRYWGFPDWPIQTRNSIWKQIAEAGGDFLLANDLDSAIKF